MQKGIESISQFVVSRGDASELFEPIEETFDKVASLVTMPVDQTLCLPILARRNIGFYSVVFNGFDQFVAVVTFIRSDCFSLNLGNQSSPLGYIGNLARSQNQANRITQGINTSMNLGGQPATRTADRLIATVFLGAPAECWWARTIVASMKSSSRSASSCSASATRHQTPDASQRAKRTYTECQLPNARGRSRYGQPVRAINSTASTKRRLSAARPPLSVGLPGSKSAIRDHCLSFNIRRFMCNIQISGCKHKLATVNRP